MGAGEEGAYSPLITSYADYSQAQCFALPDTNDAVACLSQQLNVTDPPSVYTYTEYPQLWEPITCLLFNVSLGFRVDAEGTFNYCSVPLRGYDAFLFVSLALLATAVLFGRLAAVWVLVAGGILGAVNYYANLLQISNSIALWLSVQPADLFFYAFLPPLLLEQALRIDFFVFRKIWVHALLMAFVMVVLSALALTPTILFVLGFQNRGWSWVHGALFSAIIAPTDALAVGAILARANGPQRLTTIMEGECLFNDASAFTLYELFVHIIYTHTGPDAVWPSVWSVIPEILLDTLRLACVGMLVGLAMSIATRQLLRWLRWRGAQPMVETTVVLAVAYLSYYVANSPARGSGVIAVVVFGLYGNATSKWGMLADAEESGAFDAVWDMVSFAANGLVFFWSGVASVNYTIRSVSLLDRSAWSYAAIPFIYIFMLLIRCGCMAFFNPLFRFLGQGLSAAEIFFIGWAGLRGSVSLIMVSGFTTGSFLTLDSVAENSDSAAVSQAAVNADISLWAASFVVLTLAINGPGIAPLLRLLKLNNVPPEKLKMRARAKNALLRFTDDQMARMKEDDEDEIFHGAHWDAVEQYVDFSEALKSFGGRAEGMNGGGGSGMRNVDARTAKGVATLLWNATLGSFLRNICGCMLVHKKEDSLHATSANNNIKKTGGEANGEGFGNHFDDRFPHYPNSNADGNDFVHDGGSRSGATSSFPMPTETTGDTDAHDAWSDVSATELLEELGTEVPFLRHTTDVHSKSAGHIPPPAQPAGHTAVPDIETGLITDSAPMPKSVEIVSIAKGEISWEDDQACLQGAAGAKMLNELRRTLSTAAVAPDYYATVPSGVGAELQQQLVQQLSSLESVHQVGPEEIKRIQPDYYYRSLPVIAGRRLQEQLQQEVTAKDMPINDTENVPSLPQGRSHSSSSMDVSSTVSASASLSANARRHLAEEIQSKLNVAGGPWAAGSPSAMESTAQPSSTVTMPAATGRALQAKLNAALPISGSSTPSRSGFPSTLKRPSHSRTASDVPSSSRGDYDMYHHTVSGVSGGNLQQELRQHLQKSASRVQADRDLLGRRVLGRVPRRTGSNPSTPRGCDGTIQDRQDEPPSGNGLLATEAPLASAMAQRARTLQRSRSAWQHQSRQRFAQQTGLPGIASSSGVLPSRDKTSLHPKRTTTTKGRANEFEAASQSAMLISRTYSVDDSQLPPSSMDSMAVAAAAAATIEQEPEAQSSPTSASPEGPGQSCSDHDGVASERGGSSGHSGEGDISSLHAIAPAALKEMRTRLAAGLSRRFFARRMEGLLSVDGLRILQYVCERCAEEEEAEERLHMWAWLEREISGGLMTRIASRCSLWTTIVYKSSPKLIQRIFSWPFKQVAGLLRRHLGQRMLMACEVAVEYYLALLGSPQVLWLQSQADAKAWELLHEIQDEAEAAHRFIIAREIEAPDRFQAIQSYRAAMAILQQQTLFVSELFEAGMVDHREKQVLIEPIEHKLRRLEIVGPVWRPPRPKAVLQGLPFMSPLPSEEFRRFWEDGVVTELQSGQCFWAGSSEVRRSKGVSGPGAFVVLSGIVRRVYESPSGVRREYYQGTGGVVGVLLCMTGTQLRGTELAIAEGNALGRGPVVFHLPQAMAWRIVERVDGDDTHISALYNELMRLSAAYVLENTEAEIVEAVANHVTAVVPDPKLARAHNSGVVQLETKLKAGGDGQPAIAEMPIPPKKGNIAELQGELRQPAGGLTSSKSVRANMAAMLQQIAALEADDGGVSSDEEAQDLRSRSTKLKAARCAPQLAAAVLQDHKRKLHFAVVVRLSPEALFIQESHVVLVAGSLLPLNQNTSASVFSKGTDVTAPKAMPWLRDTMQVCNPCSSVAMSTQESWKAGSEGAVLVMCLLADGSMPPFLESYLAAQQRARKPSTVSSFPLAHDESNEIAARVEVYSVSTSRVSSVVGGSEPNSLRGAMARSLGREWNAIARVVRRPNADGS